MKVTTASSILFVVGLLSCRKPELVGTDAVLHLSPVQLDFPVTLVGDSTSFRAELTNPSRASQSVLVQVPAPFAGPSSLEVPGGETVSFELLFLPTTVGAFSKTVTVGAGPAALRLELTGTATAPITCARAPAACRVMKPTAEGTCVEVDAVEDSACSTPCVEAGVCRQGRCLGAARSCDDTNACTDDACAEETGCVHSATTCPLPSNPCQAPSCDARTGCGISDVVDGTACGPNTCVTAKVCVAGECREVSAPEGSTCAPATPCRSAGTCQQRQCTQSQPAPLRAAWTYQSPGGALLFPGVGDRSGNVFWLETIGSTTWLVSVAFDGTERFRTRMAGVPNEGSTYPTPMSPLMLVSDTQLIVLLRDAGSSTTGGHRVEARSAIDGTLQWSRSRADFVAPLGLRDGVTLWLISAGVVGTPPRVFLNLRINEGGAAWTSWIVALDASSGAFAWKMQSTYLSSAIADEDTVYAYEDLWRHVVIATAANGLPRWSLDVTGSAAAPASAFAGTLATAFPAALRDARNGAVTFQPTNASWGTHNTLLANGRVIALDNMFCPRSFMVMDPSTPRPPFVWEVRRGTGAFSACLTEPIVTSRQSVLFAGGTDLYEVGLDGLERFICPLPVFAPTTTSFIGATVLARGRWVVGTRSGRVEAYDVPAQETARQGWVTAGGGLDRANRPTR